MSAEERNKKAEDFVRRKILEIEKKPPKSADEDQAILNLLTTFVPISQMGFRGIVLTAIVGKYISPSFDPVRNFYDCHPRSIFEGGIRQALIANTIPCGKSDPLNVAKNANRIDKNWAAGKRPEAAAMAVVEFLAILQRLPYNSAQYKKMVDLFFYALLELRKELLAIKIHAPKSVSSDIFWANRIARFAIECPEAGAVPQFIFGALLKVLRRGQNSQRIVHGIEDSVFGTNTTSKKPGDIWEEADNKVVAIYEITVKPIDENRLVDCVQNLHQLNHTDRTIRFVCDMPDNTSGLTFENKLPLVRLDGITFEFISLEEWIITTYINLETHSQTEFRATLNEFISRDERPAKTKRIWNSTWGEHM